MSSGAVAMFTEWAALVVCLLVVRHALFWLALRVLKPEIVRRITLPEGFKVTQKMHYGMAYWVAQFIGLIALAMLIASPAHLLLLLFDRGWDAGIASIFGGLVLAGIGFVLLDRFAVRLVSRHVGLTADWRSRSR